MAENVPPQWDSPEFQAIRQSLMARFECSDEDAIGRLQAMWTGQAQRRSPTPPAPPPPDIPPEEEEPQPTVRKKNPFTDFDLEATIPEQLPYFPAQFATDKIKSMEYVELWYFTTEGITDASKITPTAADDTYGLTHTETGLTLQQVKASKASRNAVHDEALSWEQIMTARHNIISSASMWPEKHRVALAEFFMNLEARKAAGSKPRPLILYQATVRRLWHHTLKGAGQPFNIANINNGLLLKLENEIRDRDQEEILKKGKYFPSPQTSNVAS